MRIAVALLTVFATALPLKAQACSIRLPPVAQTAQQVAQVGVLIEAEVIQSFDADKQQPEIIRAKAIFVGDGQRHDFVIYRSRAEYERAKEVRAAQKRRSYFPVCPEPWHLKAGERFERLVLVPANTSTDVAANGRWTIPLEGNNVAIGRGLDMMLEQAAGHGRFKARPPKSEKWGDCMTCSAPKGG